MSLLTQAKKAFIRQRDESDCGVACLSSALLYFGGFESLERLREWSGTESDGTTVLGLFQAANRAGLEAEAFAGDMPSLRQTEGPVILHILTEDKRPHYVLCYGYQDDNFLISDPSSGVRQVPADELEERWVSKTLVTLSPGADFVTKERQTKEKVRWLKELLRDDYNILSTALVLGFFVSLLSLAVAVFSQKLLDQILPERQEIALKIGLALLFFLLLVKSGITYLRQFLLVRQSRDFNNRIIDRFFGSLLRLPKSFFDSRKTGDLVARINDASRIQQTLSYVTSTLLIDVLLILITLIFIFNYAFILGVVSLLNIPLLVFIIYRFHQPVLRSSRKVMESYAASESNFVDTITGIGAIKSGGTESFFGDQTNSFYRLLQDRIFGLGVVGMKFNFTTEVAATLIMIVTIGLSAFMVLGGDLQIGEMMATIQMTAMMLPSANRLALTNMQLQEARVAFDRLYEFTSLQPEQTLDKTGRGKDRLRINKLEIDHISFRYPGRPLLLSEVSLCLVKGQISALLGESGGGKTTLSQILQRFYTVEAGTIRVNDREWGEISTLEWRKTIGVVPQDIKIFNGSLLYNILLGRDQKRIESFLVEFAEAGLTRLFSGFSQGYGTLVGENGINLSEGQKQIVALARALYDQPQILLLDEPTAALDRETAKAVMKYLNQIREDVAILLITHSIPTARMADHIYVLENGKIGHSGSHEELIKTDNLYSGFWRETFLD